MQSKATTVQKYLAELPADRRVALEVVRKVILKNLDKDYEEGMLYGMIGYYVPHRLFPQGYHCDPTQPIGIGGLASQKNYMSVYLMSVYSDPRQKEWFEEAWAKTGKKLDMGKCCIRFKDPDDLALDVIGEAIRRVPAKEYIKMYLAILNRTPAEKAAARAKSMKKATAKPTRSAASNKRVKASKSRR